jgi:hypothetical protein
MDDLFDRLMADVVVERHNGRLIFLEYIGEGEINTTVMLVGKGITFDTGGLDIKGRDHRAESFDRSMTIRVDRSSRWYYGNDNQIDSMFVIVARSRRLACRTISVVQRT